MSSMSIPQSFSPLSRLQNTLASEVSSGAINSGDQSALNSALSDIDSTLRSQGSSAGSPPSPDAMKSKIDSLIADEVKSGKLTSAQGDELKTVFAKAFQGGPGGSGGPGGGGGPGGAGGGGGAGKTSSDSADANGDGVVTAAEQAAYDAKHPGSADATSETSSTSSSASNSDTSKLLSDFLKLVQESQTSSSNYSANGDSLSSKLQSLIVNYQA
jgi:hypothetical protein